MSSDQNHQRRLTELTDKSILSWVKAELVQSVIASFHYRSFSKGQFIQEKLLPTDFAILLSGKASLAAGESNLAKGNILPGRSFELNSFIKGAPKEYKWVADDDVVIGIVDFNFLKENLITSGAYEYLKRISTSVELQKFKNDLRMLGASNALVKEVITTLEVCESLPLNGELALLAQGSVTLISPENETELRTLRISDYFIWKESTVRVTPDDEAKFWTLPLTYDLFRSIDKSLAPFFDVIGELEKVLGAKAEENYEAEAIDEPEEAEDFETDHFKKEQRLPFSTKASPVAIRQHDSMDCGAACMAMIGQYYKRQISIGTWRRLIHITREGASMLSIKTAANQVGFDSIGVMAGPKSLMSFKTPFIALMAYHYVVIYEINEDKVKVADPARGLVTLTMEEFRRDYSQNSLLLLPNEKLKTYPETPPAYRKYLELFRPHYYDFFQIMLFSTLLFLMNLAPPLFTQYIFDTVIPTGNVQSMKVVSIAAMVFAFFMALLSILRLSFLIKIASTISLKLTSLFFRQIMKLPFGYFSIRNVGDITTRVDELDKIRSFFTNDSVQIFLDVLALIVYTSILSIYHPYFTYLILISIALVILSVSKLTRKVKEQTQDLFQSMGSANSAAFEQFHGIRSIQNMAASMQARWRWEEKQSRALDKRQKIQDLSATTMSVSTLVQQVIQLSFLSLAIYLFLEKYITIGQVVAATSISAMIIRPIISLINAGDNIAQLKVSFEKIDEIVTSKVEDQGEEGPFPSSFETIEFRNIWYKYGSEFSPWILKDFNLRIKRGQKIAFVGPSGSGKSTASYMLNLIYQPQKGEVLFDGVDNSKIALEDLRSNIAMIVQDNSILSGTVLFNITLGDPNPDLTKAAEAAKLAEAHDFIMTLPNGYQTQIAGESGVNISGGQRQRISIARAIYKNPSVIVMDEATSALDTITEKKIINNLYQHLKDTTCITVAHRFNTIMMSDVIVVIKDGRIKEVGPHGELMRAQGLYYQMFKKQINL